MKARLTAEELAEIRSWVARYFDLGNASASKLLAELDAVTAERDEARASLRALSLSSDSFGSWDDDD